MNVLDTLKNPVVIGGGALLGVVMLMRSSGANAAVTSTADAINPTVMSAQVQMNTAAMGAQVQLASINADLAKAAYAANVTDHANLLSYLTNIDNNNAMVEQTRAEANAGVTNSLIASNTAIIVDQSNNAERLGEAYQQTAQSQIQANANVSIARYQYLGQKAAAHASLIGTIAGTIGKVVTTGISAATGMPLPGAFY